MLRLLASKACRPGLVFILKQNPAYSMHTLPHMLLLGVTDLSTGEGCTRQQLMPVRNPPHQSTLL